jgi:hypothetical protein
MAMLMIGGQAVPSPCTLRVEILDMGTGRRNALGGQVIDRVAVKRRLSLGWARLTGAELELIWGLAGGAGVFFEVMYPDGGQARTMTAYAEEKNTRLLSCENGIPIWTDVSLFLKEK